MIYLRMECRIIRESILGMNNLKSKAVLNGRHVNGNEALQDQRSSRKTFSSPDLVSRIILAITSTLKDLLDSFASSMAGGGANCTKEQY